MLRPAALVLATLLAACASSSSSSPDDASSTGALQAGIADPGHPAVGMLWQNSGDAQGVFCSGTLVAPDVVLAAAHCVADITDATFYTGAGAAQSEFSETPPPGMVAHAVAVSIADPDYVADPGCPKRTPDVGLFRLAAPITDITPVPYARQPTATPGMTCDGVGFGIHADATDETAGQKRTGTETVRAIASASIEVGAGTGIADSGDSGGPLLCGGVIAGVTSCHLDGEWPQHKVEQYARLDAAAAWIDRQINAWHASSPPVR